MNKYNLAKAEYITTRAKRNTKNGTKSKPNKAKIVLELKGGRVLYP